MSDADAGALAEIRALAMRESLERLGRFDARRARDRLLSAFSAEHTRQIVVDGERVGLVVVRPVGDGLLLDHLYLVPAAQGRGLGSAVLAEVLAEADARGLPIRVGALKGSDANRFYRRHGFALVETAEWDHYYVRVARSAGGVRIVVAPPDFSDWPDLYALLRAAYAYMEGRIDPPSSLLRMDAAQLEAKSRDETLILAFDGERLAGCVFAALRDGCVYLGKLAVDASVRRRGIARGLMDAAEALARAKGRPCLELETRVELVENHATFAALGFAKVSENAHPGFDRATSVTMRRAVAA